MDEPLFLRAAGAAKLCCRSEGSWWRLNREKKKFHLLSKWAGLLFGDGQKFCNGLKLGALSEVHGKQESLPSD